MNQLPTVEEAGAIAVGLSGSLGAKEQVFFIAGFQEAVKYLMSNQEIQRTKKSQG